MDVRDRKSGLVNWLTVSPLYLPMGDSAFRAPLFLPPSHPLSHRPYSRNHRFAFPIFAALSRYLLRFLPLPALFRLTTDQIERSYAVRSCIWPAVWISDLSACNFRTVESALCRSHVRDCRSLCELIELSLCLSLPSPLLLPLPLPFSLRCRVFAICPCFFIPDGKILPH